MTSSEPPFNLQKLIDDSSDTGWASTTLDKRQVWTLPSLIAAQAARAGYEPVSNRRSQGVMDTLKPTKSTDANPNSLSSVTGLEQQPLHTDGAHQENPPDIVLLWAINQSIVPTRIWRPSAIPDRELHGMFSVTDGKDFWISPAWDDDGNYRFDPCCMHPLDYFSKQLSKRFTTVPEAQIERFYWDKPNSILLIRNRKVLHGRAGVTDRSENRTIHRIALRRVNL